MANYHASYFPIFPNLFRLKHEKKSPCPRSIKDHFSSSVNNFFYDRPCKLFINTLLIGNSIHFSMLRFLFLHLRKMRSC